jgi:hypothetical protein
MDNWVDKMVNVVATPIGTIIYATNMIPETVYRFGKSDEQYAKDVKEAIERFQKQLRGQNV